MRAEFSVPTSLRVRVLGPLEVYRDGALVALPSGQMSRLLGVLLLRAGSVVPVDTLLEILWDNDFPGSARKLIQARMSRLRQVFGSGPVTLSGSRRGYRLDIPPGVLDLHEFRELRAQAVGKPPEVVADLLRRALSLWRGPALAELGATIRGRQLTQALQEERLATVEAHADAALACGRLDGIALGLADVLAVHPLRERLRAQLMLVLHRSGRQAEALSVFDEGRRLLAEELGMDPGSELCAAHAAVLAGNARALAPARGGGSRRVADRLRESRRRRFVGRVAEIAVFQAAVTRVDPTVTVVFVHGAGGVGKTALLNAFAEVARDAGVRWVRVDGRTVPSSPAAFTAAVGTALGNSPDVSLFTRLEEMGRCVLAVDTYEALAPIDVWVREKFLPDLPVGTLVVIAGRFPPSTAWTADPGWRDMLTVLPLRNLRPDESRAYLREAAVPDRLHKLVLAATHGHPLALSLLVDVLSQRGTDNAVRVDLRDSPDVVRMLLDRFIKEVPTPRHRRALEVCAHVRATTEVVLRAGLDGDGTDALFDWLRGLSFIAETVDGLVPHDLARDAFDADLWWRDRATYTDLHRRLWRHFLHQVETGHSAARQAALTDLVFLQRANPVLRHFLDWASLGKHYPDILRPADHAAIIEMTERHQGAESAALVAHWMDRQPDAFVIARDAGGEVMGYGTRLRLHEASPADLAVDPGTRAMWDYAQRHDPPRPGQEVIASRFFMDRDAYQQPSTTFNVITINFVQQDLGNPRLSWKFLGAYEDVDSLAAQFTDNDYHRAPGADYVVGGRGYQVVAKDMRRLNAVEMLKRQADGVDAGFEQPLSPPEPPTPVVVLSKSEFAEAVRQALRDLHRPDRLRRNPLLRSRLVREHAAYQQFSDTETLRQLVHEAAETLRDNAPGHEAYGALDRTYLRPAPTRRQSAEALDLPFGTYRRHLTAATDHVVELLWQRELHTPDSGIGS